MKKKNKKKINQKKKIKIQENQLESVRGGGRCEGANRVEQACN